MPKVDKSLRQTIKYKDKTFPFGIWKDVYAKLVNNTLNCHRHNDFEYNYVLSGTVDFYINDMYIKLNKGDCLFISSNVLHTARQPKHCNNAVVSVLTFSTDLLTSNVENIIYKKYFQPVLISSIQGFKITKKNSPGNEVRELLEQIQYIERNSLNYEFECLKYIIQLWIATLKYMQEEGDLHKYDADIQYTERMEKILLYIHQHYKEKITADDIAKHVNISRGELFRCFKRFMNKQLVNYINEYRLIKAVELLKTSEKSISNISMECGFGSSSYFTTVFKKTYAIAPLSFRNKHK